MSPEGSCSAFWQTGFSVDALPPPMGISRASSGEPSELAFLALQAEELAPDQASVVPSFARVVFLDLAAAAGLVLDWSMALPVVATVAPGSPAACQAELVDGQVLVAVNGRELVCGVRREEVEVLFLARPLVLIFEALAGAKPGLMGLAPWRKHHGASTYSPPSSPAMRGDPAAEGAKATRAGAPPLRRAKVDLLFKETLPGKTFSGMSAASVNGWRSRPLSAQATTLGLQLPHFGEPGSTSGGPLPLPPAAPLPRILSEPLLRGQNLADLRVPYRDAAWASLPRLAQPFAAVPRARPHYRAAGQEACRERARRKILLGMGRGMPSPPPPDVCYEGVEGAIGPGPPVRWALQHGEHHWVCRLSDFVLATRIREAYECGFKGYKADPGGMQLPAIEAYSNLVGRWTRAKEVACNLCGLEIVNIDTAAPFYFCRRCKKGGGRYELCVACHASEVLQGEGKYTGKGVHPHWEHCKHQDLRRYTRLADAYPTRQHLWRACCDLCGHTIQVADAEGSSIYVCRTCPEARGYRFELCEPCVFLLKGRKHELVREFQRQSRISAEFDAEALGIDAM